MSESASTSLKAKSIDISASASASYGLASGSVNVDSAKSDTQAIAKAASTGTFTYQLAPGETIPQPAGGWKEAGKMLDSAQCSGWIDNMKAGNNGQGDYVSNNAAFFLAC